MMLYSFEKVACKVGQFSLSVDRCELREGETYSVVGPNGSGKSTFLNLLAFLAVPFEGKIIFRGKEVNYAEDIISLRLGIGYTMQNPYLFTMSVEENIGYGLAVRGVSKAEIRKRVASIAERMDLAHLARRRSTELSVGEAQRVALARTLVLDAKVILLDEPTASVDASNVRTVEKTVLELCREHNATLVLSTHSEEQARRMAPHTITVRDGRVLADD